MITLRDHWCCQTHAVSGRVTSSSVNDGVRLSNRVHRAGMSSPKTESATETPRLSVSLWLTFSVLSASSVSITRTDYYSDGLLEPSRHGGICAYGSIPVSGH